MTTTRRYRIVKVNQGTMARVEDTGRPDFGVRGRSAVVVSARDIEDARRMCDTLEAAWQATR